MSKDVLFNTVTNVYLRIRYSLFKKWLKRKDFSDRFLLFSNDLKSLNGFEIGEGFYNDNDVWFSKDGIKLVPEGISIPCYKDTQMRTTWQGTRTTNWTSSLLSTKPLFTMSNGVWVVKAKLCDSWLALWLLKDARLVKGHTKKTIIPEIDLLEIINHRVRHTIHYGYTDTSLYKKYSIGSSLFKNDDSFHEFAVEILNDGYKFYIDGILTARLKSSNEEFVSKDPNFLIINNAADKNTKKNTEFIVSWIKAYK